MTSEYRGRAPSCIMEGVRPRLPCDGASDECAKNGDGRDRTRGRSRAKPLSFTLRVADGRLEGEALDGEQRYVLRATRLVD